MRRLLVCIAKTQQSLSDNLELPGLPKEPLASRFDLTEEGEIVHH